MHVRGADALDGSLLELLDRIGQSCHFGAHG